jgi:hypothetical protein
MGTYTTYTDKPVKVERRTPFGKITETRYVKVAKAEWVADKPVKYDSTPKQYYDKTPLTLDEKNGCRKNCTETLTTVSKGISLDSPWHPDYTPPKQKPLITRIIRWIEGADYYTEQEPFITRIMGWIGRFLVVSFTLFLITGLPDTIIGLVPWLFIVFIFKNANN